MATIRDMESGRIVDVEDTGRRITFKMPVPHEFECCLAGHALCEGHDGIGEVDAVASFDKADLLALLGGKR